MNLEELQTFIRARQAEGLQEPDKAQAKMVEMIKFIDEHRESLSSDATKYVDKGLRELPQTIRRNSDP